MNRKLLLVLGIVAVIFVFTSDHEFTSISDHKINSAIDDELVSAVSSKDCNKVAELLANGASPDSLFEDVVLKIKMPVIYIGPINDGGCIKKLLVKNGADINYQVFYKYKDNEGFYITPLSSSVMHGAVDEIELLLKLGANIEEVDKYGNNLIERAFEYRGNSGPKITKRLRKIFPETK